MSLLLACLTLTDLRVAECNTFCRYKGYDLGRYEDSYCLCVNKVEWLDTQDKRIVLPEKKKKPSRDY